ncbi:MAG: hypothetical protein M3N08_06915 [Pseudomonadota bacterium]|nr:hypothetical protein [Pseudomonadota bacterium]
MAKMYPPQLPDRVLSDRRLKGEIKTYEALAQLSDEFEVFYNRSTSAERSARAHKRRIDFILLHRQLGFLAIEVKGGKIRIGQDGGFEQYHPSKSSWASVDPHKQVEVATIQLIKAAKADGADYWIPDNVCVVFPDTMRREITDLPQYIPDGTLCADDLGLLPTQIKTLFAKSRQGQAWPPDAFLDMRRRLQNMPEVRGSESSSNSRPKSDAFKPARERSPWPSKKRYSGPRPPLSKRSKLRINIKWWEVVLAFGTLIITAAASILVIKFIQGSGLK